VVRPMECQTPDLVSPTYTNPSRYPSNLVRRRVYVDLKSLNIQWMCPTEPPPGHVITPPISPTTPSRGEPSVPAGWKPKWHQSYGAWYYVNSQTGKSQWNRPQYAAIPANAYSPIDHSHKPVDWDECAPSPLVTKYPKSLHLSLNLDRQPMSGFEHLYAPYLP
jgi:hypothetical protein